MPAAVHLGEVRGFNHGSLATRRSQPRQEAVGECGPSIACEWPRARVGRLRTRRSGARRVEPRADEAVDRGRVRPAAAGLHHLARRGTRRPRACRPGTARPGPGCFDERVVDERLERLRRRFLQQALGGGDGVGRLAGGHHPGQDLLRRRRRHDARRTTMRMSAPSACGVTRLRSIARPASVEAAAQFASHPQARRRRRRRGLRRRLEVGGDRFGSAPARPRRPRRARMSRRRRASPGVRQLRAAAARRRAIRSGAIASGGRSGSGK